MRAVDVESDAVRGQYTAGLVEGQPCIGYLGEPGVDPRSRTETFQTTVEDKRFQWKQLKAQNLEVDWYTGDDNYGRGLGGRCGDAGVACDRPGRQRDQ